MNFIVIMSDTLRPDHLEAYGADHCRTPNSRRLAESAVVFERAHVGSFATIPNRTDLFTGRFGEPFHPWLPLSYDAVTLPRILRENGYATQLICDTPHLINGGHNFDFPFHAWQMIRGNEVDRFGMDSDPVELPYHEASKVRHGAENATCCQYMRNMRGRRLEEEFVTWQTFQTAINWLQRNARHENFFLWIDGFDPHEPQIPPQPYIDMYDPGYDGDVFLTHVPDPSALSDAEVNNIKARYRGMVTFVDRCVGRLLDALETVGRADDTCVIWTSDHGTHLNEHGRILSKSCEYDEVARVVMMMRAPGLTDGGRRSDALVQPADVAPTVLELAGLPVPDWMQGVSGVPALRGEDWAPRATAFTASGHLVRRIDQPKWRRITVRDGRWVLVDAPTAEERVLYDLAADPGQTRDVAADHPDEVARLHEAALEFLRTHDAPVQLVRLFETGETGDMDGYVYVRPGYENYRAYFGHLMAHPSLRR